MIPGKPRKTIRKMILAMIVCAIMIASGLFTVLAEGPAKAKTGSNAYGNVEEILSSMTLDDKISQMIIPAIRTWEGKNVTDLSDFSGLRKALRAHQYGGIILFGANVTGPGQVTALVQQLQANNLKKKDTSAHVPYFMAADEEGGVVVRLSGGTRMTGNMAIGATGENAGENAEKTGRILGEEMAAAGLNVNFAPDIDVNNNAANPVIGNRSFSDDPDRVAALGKAWAGGLSETGVIASFKHFPGHGDTSTDSHIGTPSVEKTYDQIKKMELVPFAAAVEDGAEMIMTAHITYPLIDEEVVFGDGKTKGFYPATMSKKIITDILRGDLGYEGVVVTDALEMDAIRTAGLVPGKLDSTLYRANVAKKVIEAGIDLLLIPCDMNGKEAASFYDDYIDALAAMVKKGAIPQKRIDESVTRILKLKEKHGILDLEQYSSGKEEAVRHAQEVIGSGEHHAAEMEIARQAVTLLKNEGKTIPFTQKEKKIVILCREKEDANSISYAVGQLMEEGFIDKNTRILNLAQGEQAGSDQKDRTITIDYYYDPSAKENTLHYTKELKKAIRKADVVAGLTSTYSLGALEEDSGQYQGISRAIADSHKGGGRFVLLSNNLPYDAARYQEADAILLAYMGTGLYMDPTQRTEEGGNMGTYNANVLAAIRMIFGDGTPEGTLPVRIPEIIRSKDGSLACSDRILYERGFGLTGRDE